MLLLATTAAFFPAYAFQLPFKLPFNFFSSASQTPLIAPPEVPETQTIPNRVAIIGAGAAGSSAAFWISKAKERYGLDVEIDVYDKNAYIGGRKYPNRVVTSRISSVLQCNVHLTVLSVLPETTRSRSTLTYR